MSISDTILEVLKHLPGQHSQLKHAGRIAKVVYGPARQFAPSWYGKPIIDDDNETGGDVYKLTKISPKAKITSIVRLIADKDTGKIHVTDTEDPTEHGIMIEMAGLRFDDQVRMIIDDKDYNKGETNQVLSAHTSLAGVFPANIAKKNLNEDEEMEALVRIYHVFDDLSRLGLKNAQADIMKQDGSHFQVTI